MRKLLLLATVFVALTVQSQNVQKFKPYASAGVSLSSNVTTYGGELGVYNAKSWFALGIEAYANPVTTGNEVYLSAKAYFKIATYDFIDTYAYTAFKVHAARYKDLVFEPGVVAVFNIAKKWAPQLSFTLPISENSQPFNPTVMSLGVSINYWIK